MMIDSRRVSLPVCLPARLVVPPPVSPPHTSPVLSRAPYGRRSLPSTPGARRSLPGTPRNLSPRSYLPDVDEHQPSSPSSSSRSDCSEHSPRRHSRRRYQQRKGDSLRDSLLDSSSFNNNSIIREDECEQPAGCLRSFALRHGELIDRGWQRQMPTGGVHIAKRESRRATCPDILLFPEPGKAPRKILLRIYGAKNTGKKTVAHRIQHHATYTCTDQVDVEKENETVDNPVKFLLNEEEMQMEVLIESALESSPFLTSMTVFAVVYNVDSRESFSHAAQMLSRICRHRSSYSSFSAANSPARVILVGNKIDLKRNQIVSTIEGRSLAKIYKCGFIEVSALLSMNVDEMWAEILKLLQEPEYLEESSWMERVMKKGRNFAKSCEELVHRMIA